MYHCDLCGWDGETPALREWVGEGCGGVVWTRPVCGFTSGLRPHAQQPREGRR